MFKIDMIGKFNLALKATVAHTAFVRSI